MLNVIIPTYKARDTIEDTLRSLLAQTKKMFLTTIVQDCDGEDYVDIVNKYNNLGLHINLLCTPRNGGPGNARQFGIDNTICSHVMFVDADDMLLPYAIDALTKEILSHDADLVCSNMIEEAERGLYDLIDADAGCQWCAGKIYKVSYLKEKNIRFREDLRLNEDSYFNFVAVSCTTNIFFLNQPTYLWRNNKNSLTRKDNGDYFFINGSSQYIKSQVKALEKIIELNGEDKVEEDTIISTIYRIYRTYMEILESSPFSFAIDLKDEYALMKELLEIPKVTKTVSDKNFYKKISRYLTQTGYANKDFFFYNMNFREWMDSFII